MMAAKRFTKLVLFSVLLGVLAAPAARACLDSGQAPQFPQYPDSAEGLTSLTHDLLDAIKKGDAATTNAFLSSLVLPNPDSWFSGIFEKDLGRESAAEYTEMLPSLPAMLTAAFQDIATSGATPVNGIRFAATCDREIDGNMLVLLSMRKRDKPLYEIRYGAGAMQRAIWAFAYADGGFRYIGNTRLGFGKPPKTPAAATGRDGQSSDGNSGPGRVSVGGEVQRAKMLRQVQPEYPEVARANHVTGTVILHAIIGKDGTVRQIQVKQGPCMLDEAAIRAVRQWRYSPTTLKGEPVEVDTTISVTFTLNHL